MPDLILEDGRGLVFLDEADCPRCNQTFGDCRCGLFNEMTLDGLVAAGFAKYVEVEE